MATWGDPYPVGAETIGIDWRSLLEIVLTFVLLTLWAALWLR